MARKLEVVITGDSRSLERALGRSEKATAGFGRSAGKAGGITGKFSSVLGGISGPALAVTAGISATAFAVKGFLDKGTESEVVTRKMQAQLDALGISYSAHAKQIDDVITKHSQLTGIDDEDLTDAFTKIVRVTGNVNKALKLNTIAANLARARNMDLGSAAELVGKVYAGKLGTLSRYGIVLKKNATSTEALTELERRFAGQAEASATGQQKLAVAFENIQESLGKKLLPAFERFANWLSARLPEWQAKVTPVLKAIGDAIATIAPIIETLMPVLSKLANFMISQMVAPIEVIAKLLSGDFSGAWEAAMKPIKAFVDLIDTAFGPAIDYVGERIQDVVDWFTALPRKIASTFGALASQALTPFKDAFTAVKNWVGARVDDIVRFFTTLPARILATFAALLNVALTPFRNLFTSSKELIGQRIDQIVQFFIALPARIAATLANLASTALNPFRSAFTAARDLVGTRIGDIVEFFQALPGRIAGTIGNLISNALGPFKRAFQDAAGDVVRALNKIIDALGEIKDGIVWLGNKAGPVIRAGVGGITAALGAITDAFAGLASVVGGVVSAVQWLIDNIPNIPSPHFPDLTPGFNLPGFASGGIVRRPTIAMIGEKGPEAVVPLSKTFGADKFGGGQPVVINFNGPVAGEKALAEIVRREFIRTGNRQGSLGFA